MERLVFHIDVNSAFLSWEAARRVKNGEEDIRLVPSCISGNPERRTSVILAKSIPAKEYGVKTGDPIGSAIRKCPHLIIAKPDFLLYQKYSSLFMDICREYTPVVEKYSIDECFMDMSGTSLLYPDPIKTAYEIKDRIKNELGFTVNIGIGPNKLLAKTAGDFEKPDKVHTLFFEELPKKFWTLPVSSLFGVGHSTEEKLIRSGISTVGKLSQISLKTLKSIFGDKMGKQLHRSSLGIDDSPVLGEPPKAKGYSISTTLEYDISDTDTALQILLSLSDAVSSRMRSEDNKARTVSVFIRSSDFINHSHQKKLTAHTDITDDIYKTAKELLFDLWNKKTPIRLLGVSLTDLSKESVEQMSFFEESENKEKAKNIDRTVDNIRKRYGSSSISRLGSYKDDGKIGKKYKAEIDKE